VGDKDYILRSLIDAGADILFAHVRMKPGSCCYGARLGRATIISLSGNPGAALTGYFRIALPFIRKLLGRSDYSLKEELLPLSSSRKKVSFLGFA
jgi:molybdopterin molybdotransferase